MNKKDLRLCKKMILKYLTEDNPRVTPIFDKKEGHEIFYETDLSMVMDAVVAGLYAALKQSEEKENKQCY